MWSYRMLPAFWAISVMASFALVMSAGSVTFTSVRPSRNIGIASTSCAFASRAVLSLGGLSQKTSYGLSMLPGSMLILSFRQKIPVFHTEYGTENWDCWS